MFDKFLNTPLSFATGNYINGKIGMTCVNPFKFSGAFYVETSPLLCRAYQMTSFYMERNTICQKYKRKHDSVAY